MKFKNTSYPKDKINVLLLENISDAAVEEIKSEGYNSIKKISGALSEAELMKAVKDVHLLGIRSKTLVTEKVLAKANKLLAIGCYCIGVNQVNMNAATNNGVAVFNSPYSNTRSVAELVIGLSIMLIRKIADKNKAAHEGIWLKEAKALRPGKFPMPPKAELRYQFGWGDFRAAEAVISIARKGGVPSPTRDVSGEGVQQALLKILEGKQATITPDGARNRPQQELIQIDTTDILFICCGAFNGLEDIVRRRTGQRGLGFGAQVSTAEDDKDALRREARTEDLIKFGMIPEFMGRLPVIVSCDALDVEALTEVLWKPRNALAKQYHRLFELELSLIHI